MSETQVTYDDIYELVVGAKQFFANRPAGTVGEFLRDYLSDEAFLRATSEPSGEMTPLFGIVAPYLV